jgi:4-amino-4-deoxy-L-arabinose transferase-like glycosyltransferase
VTQAPPDAAPGSTGSRTETLRASLWVIGLALVVRAAVFPFADNKHGDGPMRALIAERMNLDPATAADPRTYCQFGPLHMTLMRPFLAIDPVVPRSSRYLSLLAGVLTFLPFLRLARRLVGRPRAELAAFGLAVSPLHVQASITAASEALYLLLLVAAFERFVAALDDEPPRVWTFALAGALASLAAVTRYDAWLALPAAVTAAWLFARGAPGPRRAQLARGLAVFAACAALLPLGWMAWGAAKTDDPIFFFHYISNDHAHLAATALLRYGPLLGRARQLGVWGLALMAAMTPALIVSLALSLAGRATLSSAMRVVLAAALAPPALYLAQGVLRLSFEPLPRFALVPGALLLPLATAALPLASLRVARVWAGLSAAAFAVLMLVVTGTATTWGHGRLWGGAESMGAVTRLDAEDRALAGYLRDHRAPGERVMIEPLDFAEIAITEQARVPAAQSVTLAVTRTPERTLAETTRLTGARWIAAYDRPGGPAGGAGIVGWLSRLPDWPKDALAFGRWRLVHR